METTIPNIMLNFARRVINSVVYDEEADHYIIDAMDGINS